LIVVLVIEHALNTLRANRFLLERVVEIAVAAVLYSGLTAFACSSVIVVVIVVTAIPTLELNDWLFFLFLLIFKVLIFMTVIIRILALSLIRGRVTILLLLVILVAAHASFNTIIALCTRLVSYREVASLFTAVGAVHFSFASSHRHVVAIETARCQVFATCTDVIFWVHAVLAVCANK